QDRLASSNAPLGSRGTDPVRKHALFLTHFAAIKPEKTGLDNHSSANNTYNMNNRNNQRIPSALRFAPSASIGIQNFNSMHAAAVDQIGIWIVQGRFLPGEVLPNADESKDLIGVSRSVLRDAIKV